VFAEHQDSQGRFFYKTVTALERPKEPALISLVGTVTRRHRENRKLQHPYPKTNYKKD
jgi:hypothetical protein